MKLVWACVIIAVSCSASAQRGKRDDTGAVNRTCGVGECFLEAEVRDFEVIDRTHVIVYVGSQRCAFHVELHGTFCDLTFAPELFFRRTNEIPTIAADRSITGDETLPRSGGRGFDALDQQRRERRDLRVCDNDLTVQVHGGAFTESGALDQPTDRFGNPRTDCRISSVRSITDDQLVEFYVGRGVVAPVPPMGAGQIEVGEQEDEEEGAATPERDR
jgi:hypothetical protein